MEVGINERDWRDSHILASAQEFMTLLQLMILTSKRAFTRHLHLFAHGTCNARYRASEGQGRSLSYHIVHHNLSHPNGSSFSMPTGRQMHLNALSLRMLVSLIFMYPSSQAWLMSSRRHKAICHLLPQAAIAAPKVTKVTSIWSSKPHTSPNVQLDVHNIPTSNRQDLTCKPVCNICKISNAPVQLDAETCSYCRAQASRRHEHVTCLNMVSVVSHSKYVQTLFDMISRQISRSVQLLEMTLLARQKVSPNSKIWGLWIPSKPINARCLGLGSDWKHPLSIHKPISQVKAKHFTSNLGVFTQPPPLPTKNLLATHLRGLVTWDSLLRHFHKQAKICKWDVATWRVPSATSLVPNRCSWPNWVFPNRHHFCLLFFSLFFPFFPSKMLCKGCSSNWATVGSNLIGFIGRIVTIEECQGHRVEFLTVGWTVSKRTWSKIVMADCHCPEFRIASSFIIASVHHGSPMNHSFSAGVGTTQVLQRSTSRSRISSKWIQPNESNADKESVVQRGKHPFWQAFMTEL